MKESPKPSSFSQRSQSAFCTLDTAHDLGAIAGNKRDRLLACVGLLD